MKIVVRYGKRANNIKKKEHLNQPYFTLIMQVAEEGLEPPTRGL